MKDNMDKFLLFITFSCVCVWLIVDMAIGKNYLGNFLTILFPFMDSSSETGIITKEEQEEIKETAPSSSAIGSDKKETGKPDGKSSNAITGGNGTGYGVRSK